MPPGSSTSRCPTSVRWCSRRRTGLAPGRRPRRRSRGRGPGLWRSPAAALPPRPWCARSSRRSSGRGCRHRGARRRSGLGAGDGQGPRRLPVAQVVPVRGFGAAASSRRTRRRASRRRPRSRCRGCLVGMRTGNTVSLAWAIAASTSGWALRGGPRTSRLRRDAGRELAAVAGCRRAAGRVVHVRASCGKRAQRSRWAAARRAAGPSSPGPGSGARPSSLEGRHGDLAGGDVLERVLHVADRRPLLPDVVLDDEPSTTISGVSGVGDVRGGWLVSAESSRLCTRPASCSTFVTPPPTVSWPGVRSWAPTAVQSRFATTVSAGAPVVGCQEGRPAGPPRNPRTGWRSSKREHSAW